MPTITETEKSILGMDNEAQQNHYKSWYLMQNQNVRIRQNEASKQAEQARQLAKLRYCNTKDLLESVKKNKFIINRVHNIL